MQNPNEVASNCCPASLLPRTSCIFSHFIPIFYHQNSATSKRDCQHKTHLESQKEISQGIHWKHYISLWLWATHWLSFPTIRLNLMPCSPWTADGNREQEMAHRIFRKSCKWEMGQFMKLAALAFFIPPHLPEVLYFEAVKWILPTALRRGPELLCGPLSDLRPG